MFHYPFRCNIVDFTDFTMYVNSNDCMISVVNSKHQYSNVMVTILVQPSSSSQSCVSVQFTDSQETRDDHSTSGLCLSKCEL